jgi:hypothetical protein
MHYIIGTTIKVAQYNRPQYGGVRSVTAHRVKRTNKTPFDPNKIYTLYNIRKVDEGLVYEFKDSTGDMINIDFGSTKEADTYISRLLCETVPDYDDFYSKRSD